MPSDSDRSALPMPLRLLTGGAVLLVAYSYLYALPTGHSGFLHVVRLWGNVPLGIGDDFGVFGLFVLLVVAGYLLAGVLYRDEPTVPGRCLLTVTAQLCGCYLLVLLPALALTGGLHYVGVLITALVLPIFGEVVWLTERGRIAPWQAGYLALGCLVLAATADANYDMFVGRWFPLTMVYAALAVLLTARVRLRANPADQDTVGATRRQYFHGIDLLRVLASSLVVYTHISNWFTVQHIDWYALAWFQHVMRGSLHLDRHLSVIGVFTFLLISGIVVTHVAFKETGPVLLWRRARRIVPLLVVVTTGAWAMIMFGFDVGDPKPDGADFLDLIANIDLSAYFSDSRVFVLGVTWTLAVQIAFYIYVALTVRLLHRHAWCVPAIGTVLSFTVATLTAGRDNPALFEIALISVYLPVLFLGQLVTLVRSGRMHPAAAIAVGIADYLVVVWSNYLGTGIMRPINGVPRTLLIVFVATVLIMTVRNRVTTSKLVREWSRRTYAIYLVHTVVLYPLLAVLVPVLSPLPATLLALAATALVTELLYRLVEKPTSRPPRKRRPPSPATPDPSAQTMPLAPVK